VRSRSCCRSRIVWNSGDVLLRGVDDPARLDHRNERVDHGRVVIGAGEAFDLGERLILAARRPVRPFGQHRFEGDRDGEDPGRERDLIADERVRVPGAVPALVGVANDRHDAAQEADRLEDARPQERVLLHDLFLFGREGARLRQDRGGYADLAERMEEGRVPQVPELMLAHVEALAHRDRVRCDLALMVLAVVVARHDRGHERRDRREVGLV